MTELVKNSKVPYEPSYEEEWTPQFRQWISDIVFFNRLYQQEILSLKERMTASETKIEGLQERIVVLEGSNP